MRALRPNRLSIALGALALFALWLAPSAAQADFGFLPGAAGFHVSATSDVEGQPATLAGSHPYSLITEVNFNQIGEYSDGDLKDLEIDQPAGLIENPTAINKCTAAQFSTPRESPFEASLSNESCPATSQIGIVTLKSSYGKGETRTFGVFNLAPPPGSPSQFGFAPYGVPVTITPHVRETGSEYGLTLQLTNLSQQLNLTGFKMEIWGTPWAISHDTQRGNCLNEEDPSFGHAKCPIEDLKPSHLSQAYLTLPTSCEGPLSFHIRADAWHRPGTVAATSTGAPDEAMENCDSLSFAPVPRGVLSTDRTTTPTGYDFTLDGNSAPLINPATRASSADQEGGSLPAGGDDGEPIGRRRPRDLLGGPVRGGDDLFAPGAGCPNVSKVGELVVESPIVEGAIEGSMFFATPHENRFGTLLALYLVAKAPERGLLIKVAGRVDADPATGRLTATFDDLPQLPYSHFNVNFREGQRSPLATPSSCGSYASELAAAPWRDPNFVLHESSPFTLSAGVGGGPCPKGLAPFTPKAAPGP